MNKTDLENKKAAYFITFLFISFAFVSFLYAIINNEYNGDFIGFKVHLSKFILFLNFILCIIPFCFLFFLYKKNVKKQKRKYITINYNFIEIFFYLLFVWQLFLIVVFNVGKMGREVYSAPILLTPIIQITNRISIPFLFTILVINSNNFKKILLFTIMMLLISISKASLGSLVFISMVFILKYYFHFRLYAKKHFLLLLILGIIFPIFVETAYKVRNSLRDRNFTEENDLISGRLVGRLSSFSNSAQIFEYPIVFYSAANAIDPLYFGKQALGGLVSSNFLPNVTPEILLVQSKYGENISNIAYMTGTQGNLMLAFLKSPYVFFLNLCLIIFFLNLTFFSVRLLDIPSFNEIALLISLYPIMSGVANELASLFFTPFLIGVISIVLNSFFLKTNNR